MYRERQGQVNHLPAPVFLLPNLRMETLVKIPFHYNHSGEKG